MPGKRRQFAAHFSTDHAVQNQEFRNVKSRNFVCTSKNRRAGRNAVGDCPGEAYSLDRLPDPDICIKNEDVIKPALSLMLSVRPCFSNVLGRPSAFRLHSLPARTFSSRASLNDGTQKGRRLGGPFSSHAQLIEERADCYLADNEYILAPPMHASTLDSQDPRNLQSFFAAESASYHRLRNLAARSAEIWQQKQLLLKEGEGVISVLVAPDPRCMQSVLCGLASAATFSDFAAACSPVRAGTIHPSPSLDLDREVSHPSTTAFLLSFRGVRLALSPRLEHSARLSSTVEDQRLQPERLQPERLQPERLQPERLQPGLSVTLPLVEQDVLHCHNVHVTKLRRDFHSCEIIKAMTSVANDVTASAGGLASGLVFDNEVTFKHFRDVESFDVYRLASVSSVTSFMSKIRSAMGLKAFVRASSLLLASSLATIIVDIAWGTLLLERMVPVQAAIARTSAIRSCLLHATDTRRQYVVSIALSPPHCYLDLGKVTMLPMEVHVEKACGVDSLTKYWQIIPIQSSVGKRKTSTSSLLSLVGLVTYSYPELLSIMALVESIAPGKALFVSGVKRYAICQLENDSIRLASQCDNVKGNPPGHIVFTSSGQHVDSHASCLVHVQGLRCCYLPVPPQDSMQFQPRPFAYRVSTIGGTNNVGDALFHWMAASSAGQTLNLVCSDNHVARNFSRLNRLCGTMKISLTYLAHIVDVCRRRHDLSCLVQQVVATLEDILEKNATPP